MTRGCFQYHVEIGVTWLSFRFFLFPLLKTCMTGVSMLLQLQNAYSKWVTAAFEGRVCPSCQLQTVPSVAKIEFCWNTESRGLTQQSALPVTHNERLNWLSLRWRSRSNHRGSGGDMLPCSEWQKLIISDNDWQIHSICRSDAWEQLFHNCLQEQWTPLGEEDGLWLTAASERDRPLTAKSLSAKVLKSPPVPWKFHELYTFILFHLACQVGV